MLVLVGILFVMILMVFGYVRGIVRPEINDDINGLKEKIKELEEKIQNNQK